MNEAEAALASEYALGLLSQGERLEVEARIERDSAFADHVEWWIRCFAPLSSASREVKPPADLFDRIDEQIERQVAAGGGRSATIRASEGRWIEIAPGARKKTLYYDEQSQSEAFLIELEAGASLPQHDHDGTEDCLVISGDFSIGDLKLSAGDFHAAFAASRHAPCRSEEGCQLFIKAAA
ncbi:MAG: cupin domain-containing protein [Pseudomonadota bacterium]